MARVTVEDCLSQVQNRFELVVLAAKRGKDISSGSPIHVARDNDKNGVIALREIAREKISIAELRVSLNNSLSKARAVSFNNKLSEEDVNDAAILEEEEFETDADLLVDGMEEEIEISDLAEEDEEDEIEPSTKAFKDLYSGNGFEGVEFSEDDVDIDD